MDSIKTNDTFKAAMKERLVNADVSKQIALEFMRGHAIALSVPENYTLNPKTLDFDPPAPAPEK
jgi:hypothetical protein